MILKKVTGKIEPDIRNEFQTVRNDIQNYFKPAYDIDHTKNILKDLIPQLVVGKSQILLDTLLNYLMQESLKILEPAKAELKNNFFEADFRKRIKESFKLNKESLEFSFDPRILYGGIAAGSTLVVGSTVSVILLFTPGGVITAVVTGLASLICSALAFKIAYAKTAPQSRQKLEEEVETFVADSERYVIKWLGEIAKSYITDFTQFCNEHGFRYEV